VSIGAIRALVLLGNLLLLGFVVFVARATFLTVDKDRYYVERPKDERFRVPEIAIDESQQKKDLYRAISRVLDRPPPPPPEAPPPPPPQEAPRADPRQIQVLAMNVSQDPCVLSSALLTAPLASSREPRFFQVGLDLGQPGLGFEAYKDCKVKAITVEAVIITDQKGQDVRLAAPPGRSGG